MLFLDFREEEGSREHCTPKSNPCFRFTGITTVGWMKERNTGIRVRVVASQYLDVTLSAQVVDLGGLHLVDDLHQTCAVRQIAVVQLHILTKETDTHSEGAQFFHRALSDCAVLARVGGELTAFSVCLGVLVEMLNATRVEGARATQHTVDLCGGNTQRNIGDMFKR